MFADERIVSAGYCFLFDVRRIIVTGGCFILAEDSFIFCSEKYLVEKKIIIE